MNIKRLILSCFGIGFSPVMPGTLASLLMLLVFLAVYYIYPAPKVCIAVVVVATAAASVFCLLFASEAEKQQKAKDPAWIVIDEVAGQAAALLPAAVTSGRVLVYAVAAFVLFRILDVLKPPPIYEIQQLDGGLGILIDDLVAGIMAGTIICIISFLATFAR
jgi:phosphatidylglycerophosphatase A